MEENCCVKIELRDLCMELQDINFQLKELAGKVAWEQAP